MPSVTDLTGPAGPLEALLDTPAGIVDAPDPPPPPPARGRVVFEDVRFAYRPGEEVLKGISFSVEPGETGNCRRVGLECDLAERDRNQFAVAAHGCCGLVGPSFDRVVHAPCESPQRRQRGGGELGRGR